MTSPMDPADTAQMLTAAKQHLAAGRPVDAVATARAVIRTMPEAVEALKLFGIGALLLDQSADAYPVLRLAVSAKPDDPPLESALSIACRKLGKVEDAVHYAEKAVAADPNQPQYLRALAEALVVARQFDRGRDLFARLVAMPGCPVKDRLGYATVLRRLEQSDEAIKVLEALHNDLPDNLEVLLELGRALTTAGKGRSAVDVYKKVLERESNNREVYLNLTNLYKNGANTKLAAQTVREGLKRFPDDPGLLNNYGLILNGMGKSPEAVQALDRAVERTNSRDASLPHSNAVFFCQYLDTISSQQVFDRHRAWVHRHAASIVTRAPKVYAQTADPHRPLRIGYLSADFRGHSCAFFLRSFLHHHNPDAVHVIGYSNVRRPDKFTEWFQNTVQTWRDIRRLSDAALVRQIQADRVDVLVDLSGHTAGNRLLAMAAKPAPVQATWLGYPTTTGLETIDWRISDRWLTPEDTRERFSEQIYRLPRVSHCFEMNPEITPDVAPPPSREKGSITFGSFNNYAKISDACLRQWVAVLNAVPGSKMLLKSRYIGNAEVRHHIYSRFTAFGGDADRLEMIGGTEGPKEHLEQYALMDIALDTFPYGGMTTTCEALIMGVPVISMIGERTASRYGLSVLAAVGLEDLAAHSVEDMAAVARRLADDPDRLQALRRSLRQTFLDSPMGDGPGFAKALEAAYRDMWSQWCARQVRAA